MRYIRLVYQFLQYVWRRTPDNRICISEAWAIAKAIEESREEYYA